MAASCMQALPTAIAPSSFSSHSENSLQRQSALYPVTCLHSQTTVISQQRRTHIFGAVGGLRASPWRSEILRKRSAASSARVTASVPFLPPAFGYVVLTAAASFAMMQWQMFQVSFQRRKSGLEYPKMYEDKDDSIFNCYQRAHQNTMESYPAFLAWLLVAGLAYPITASALGAVWVLGRIIYSLGYYTGNPNNRHRGSFNWFGLWGLVVTSTVFGVKQLKRLPL